MKINKTVGATDFEQWNNVRAFYNYDESAESPALVSTLALEVSAYEPPDDSTDISNVPNDAEIPLWRQIAIDDKERFDKINFQLNDACDKEGTPEISKRLFSIFLKNNLLKTGKILLSPEDEQAIRNFVADCMTYVTARADEKDGGRAPSLSLRIPVSPEDISDADLIKLSVAVSFEKQKSTVTETEKKSVDETERNIEDLIILPVNDGNFAGNFERIFSENNRRLRIGKTVSDAGLLGERQTPTLWAIRFGDKSGGGFYYDIQSQARFYAPRPIADVLETADVFIGSYSTGSSLFADEKRITFTDVDLNFWAETALTAIDDFLSICNDNKSVLNDKFEDRLSEIRRHKKNIAGKITETLIPIFDDGADDPISFAAAREVFLSAVSDRLNNAYASNIVAVFDVADVSVGTRPDTGFYGEIKETSSPVKTGNDDSAVETKEENYFPQGEKIRYFAAAADKQSGGWRFPFLFSSRKSSEQKNVSLSAAFALTHLEFSYAETPETSDKEQNVRIKFLGAPLVTSLGENSVNFPVILHVLPSSPNPVRQTFEKAAGSNDAEAENLNLSESALWNYSLTYQCEAAAQDFARISILTNEQNGAEQNNFKVIENRTHFLFAPLAQFINVYSEILSDFQTSLSNIRHSDKDSKQDFINVSAALDAFGRISGSVADGFAEWPETSPERKRSIEPVISNFRFDIILETEPDGKARIDVLDKNPAKAVSPIPPIVKIESYIEIPSPDKPDYACVSYNYVWPESSRSNDAGSQEYLSYEDALNSFRRTFILKNFNVFTTRNMSAQIQTVRNKFSGGVEGKTIVNDSFKFFSPLTKPLAPVFPSLEFEDFDLGSLPVNSIKLEDYLDYFFESLLKEAAGIKFEIGIEAFFSYNLGSSADSLRTRLPVATMTAVEIMPQSGVRLPFVMPLVEAMAIWMQSNSPGLNADSEYNFRLEIFDKNSASQTIHAPLLAVNNLFIKTSKINFI